MSAAAASRPAPHVPVLLGPVLEALAPIKGGTFIDGTFGAGGYTRALLDAGAARVIAIDRDPTAVAAGAPLVAEAGARLTLVEDTFERLDEIAEEAGAPRVDGVVLDIGVSSMQLDQAARGFSFLRDGPLDMRMGDDGPSAADVVNRASEGEIADILYGFGEERASRRIARAIVTARSDAPIGRTAELAEIVAGCLPRPKPGQPHAATRSFQALRIAVNDELGQLVRALAAAERVLSPGGRLAVVTFHSLEDRIVKRYLAAASGRAGQGSRHLPAREMPEPRFERPAKAVDPDAAELAANPRSRSARLRWARRTAATPVALAPETLGLPRAPVASELFGGRAP
ncbi:16S rRNA (cytosine(1402)-N(4))-methyltransferase RsmH [Limibaculum sp. M0105]|uniref:Ribosomal RNA small subunit methyltransferase H n=1 Tax=Thermohalobaculum xanthum TaxID=2753746 RepID=A0A8J7SE69_9RHOB|nr:16S rRNA (cytosine(1402)-N(4))-methyltransferase RsmH [Thermohalobaculum xanthum]MBK0399658.1 16S rRNA (cytosine(1402)-N(4))-methyltransferase RsmH [Thermohalobaculum xanthum]